MERVVRPLLSRSCPGAQRGRRGAPGAAALRRAPGLRSSRAGLGLLPELLGLLRAALGHFEAGGDKNTSAFLCAELRSLPDAGENFVRASVCSMRRRRQSGKAGLFADEFSCFCFPLLSRSLRAPTHPQASEHVGVTAAAMTRGGCISAACVAPSPER